ncbi:unnamed protein product [Parnassius apollo]|uniref:(apollo) hypothetical protein n=1 Tax=Parnassius apollo TaxID=110799 RepID=A0A8S3WNI3_PARAO|nr:unnamed protein product [Parnassius apollo]
MSITSISDLISYKRDEAITAAALSETPYLSQVFIKNVPLYVQYSNENEIKKNIFTPRSLTKRPLNLNDIVDALHIIFFPPEDPNNEITDEDSGDEEFVTLHNLPDSQLRAPAEITYDDIFSDRDDSENVLSLPVLAKRTRNANECLPEDLNQQISSTSCSTPSISCSSSIYKLFIEERHS